MQIHGPDPGFVRPVEAPLPNFTVPSVQSVVAVRAPDMAMASDNSVAFQDPQRDGRRSLYQELGGKYIGFFRTKDLNLHRPLNIELDFGPSAAHQEFIITMEAFLETGFSSIHHSLGLTANLTAGDDGRFVAIFPPLVKVLADPAAILGFHVYAFPMTGAGRVQKPDVAAQQAGVATAGKINLRPKGRFDSSG
ncbi:MAG: hypothetical protein H7338_01640 [Candidatus Sericytochromatia bacterium]|nr:hypothetical protein [Candidatus Sericytochromatia bacterium]